jgi:hypothetical protein
MARCFYPGHPFLLTTGIALASQLYTWFPQAITYFFTLPAPFIPIVLIEAALGMLTGIILVFCPQHSFGHILAFLPAAAV